MFNYSKSRETAERLISNYGQDGEFIKSGKSGGFDDFGNVTPDEPDIVISGIVTPLLPFSTQTMKDSYEIEGLNILAGDKYCFFHSEQEPEVGSYHTQNGEKWRVVALISSITSVDGVKVFRKYQMRK